MCLLTYLSPGSAVDVSGLENACDNNPDGFGWATVKDGRLTIRKSMDSDEAISTFVAERLAHPDSHAMFHARWATHGETSTFNVHPFYLGQGYTSVLGHNGILPDIPPKGDRRSDTRMFAEGISAKDIRKFDMGWYRKMLGTKIRGSKLVVLTIKPSAKSPFYIINEDDGHWDEDGHWWSNSSYEAPWWRDYRTGRDASLTTGGALERVNGRTTFRPATVSKPWSDGKVFVSGKGWVDAKEVNATSDVDAEKLFEDSKCPSCHGFLTEDAVKVYGTCTWCWTCLDCNSKPADCMCYMPEAVTRSTLTSRREAEEAEFAAWMEQEYTRKEIEDAVVACMENPGLSEFYAQIAIDRVVEGVTNEIIDAETGKDHLEQIAIAMNEDARASAAAERRAGGTTVTNFPFPKPTDPPREDQPADAEPIIWRPDARPVPVGVGSPLSSDVPDSAQRGYDATNNPKFQAPVAASEAVYEGWE